MNPNPNEYYIQINESSNGNVWYLMQNVLTNAATGASEIVKKGTYSSFDLALNALNQAINLPNSTKKSRTRKTRRNIRGGTKSLSIKRKKRKSVVRKQYKAKSPTRKTKSRK
jgi:hypothetical protein